MLKNSRCVGFLLMAMMIAAPLAANVIFITTLDDEYNVDGDCSLREAIIAANLDSPQDNCGGGQGLDSIISLEEGTLTLTLGALGVTDGLILGGNANMTIDGDHNSGLFEIDMIDPADDFTLNGNDMTLRGGRTVGIGGGAIQVTAADSVTIDGVRFVDNSACSDTAGGTCNHAEPEVYGGAIRVRPADSENVNTVTIRDSSFSRNEAGVGGALAYRNRTSGGVTATVLTIEDSVFTDNRGEISSGAIVWSATGAVTMRRVVAARNSTTGLGGFANLRGQVDGPTMRLENLLVVDNQAGNCAGMIVLYLPADVRYSTFARNINTEPDGSSVFIIDTYRVDVSNTVVADSVGNNCNGNWESFGFNLSDDASCAFDDADDLAQGPAMLSGLGYWQGSTVPIVVPSMASPVLDGGAASCLDLDGSAITDVRGASRPLDGDDDGTSLCDPGAVEVAAGWELLFADGFEGHNTMAWTVTVP